MKGGVGSYYRPTLVCLAKRITVSKLVDLLDLQRTFFFA